jgi:THO complex subunit 2
MHVYNAIIVMKEILPVFPLSAVLDTGASLDSAMDRFLETEERGDLKILGRAYVFSHTCSDLFSYYSGRYSAALKKREPQWAVAKKVLSFSYSLSKTTSKYV